MHHPRAGSPTPSARILEERDVRAHGAELVRVEEVVDGRVVLVDRLLHQAEPEHARVEVDVARRVAGDRGHVVDSLEAHWRLSLVAFPAPSLPGAVRPGPAPGKTGSRADP